MKIRNGFVSNSSSSSFVCWGVDSDEIKINDKMWLQIFDDQLTYYESALKTEASSEYTKNSCLKYIEEMQECKTDEEKVEYAQSKLDYEVKDRGDLIEGGPWDYGNRFVGITPETMLSKYPDRKISEIPQIVADEINIQFGMNIKPSDISYYEEGWYDG